MLYNLAKVELARMPSAMPSRCNKSAGKAINKRMEQTTTQSPQP